MRLNLSTSILWILVLSVVLILCIYFLPVLILRIVLGVPFLLLFPGYLLMAAISPHNDDMGTVKRLILSSVLSIVIVTFLGFVLNYTPFGITLTSTVVTLAVFTGIFSLAGLLRQAVLPEDEKAVLDFHLERYHGATPGSLLVIITVFVVIGAVVAGGYLALAPRTDESFTQFYIVDQNGALYSPSVLHAGEKGTIILGITNHEGSPVSYRVNMLLDGAQYTQISPIPVSDGEQWQSDVVFTPEQTGEVQVEFLLFKDDGPDPYLKPLQVRIDVMPANSVRAPLSRVTSSETGERR